MNENFNSTFVKIFNLEEDNSIFDLPFRWDGYDYYETINSLFKEYNKSLEKNLSNEDKENISFKSKVFDICMRIQNIIEKYLSGNEFEAFNEFTHLFSKLSNDLLLVEDDYKKINYYRARRVTENKEYSRNDIFHTPFNIRNKVSTTRYSISGYPSLYLSSSIELCLKEIEYEYNPSRYIISKFVINQDANIKIIDFGLKPRDFIENKNNKRQDLIDASFIKNNELMKRYVLWYPLIAACSYMRVNRSDPFSVEYVIPQLLMQTIKNIKNEKNIKINGVRYFSCMSKNASDLGFNYVFSTNREKINDKYSKSLIDIFKLTSPITLDEYTNIDYEELQEILNKGSLESLKTQNSNYFINNDEAYKQITKYIDLAKRYNYEWNLHDSVDNYIEAINIQEKILGEDNLDTVSSYNDIAIVYFRQGKYDEALKYNQKAINIQEKTLGEDNLDTATSYNNIAIVYSSQGKYDEALKYHQKAIKIREKVLGEDHIDIAASYNNIANVYENQEKYGEALKYYQKAIKIREKVLGEDHPDTAISYDGIANVYENQEKYDEALKYYQKAIKIREKVLGEDHPDTAISYNNIANVYEGQEKYDEALKYYQKAIKIKEKVLGEDHPDTAISYNNIANVYFSQKKYDEALKYHLKAIKIREKVLGEDHIDIAASYNNIANVYEGQGEIGEALKYYQKAIKIKEKILGEESINTATSYNNIANVYYRQEKYEEALKYYQKAIKINEKVLGEDHQDIAASYNNIASVYYRQEKYEEALKYYQKANRK